MAHDQNSRLKAHPKKDEAVLVLRVVGVVVDGRTLVMESCLGFFERHAMLALIREVLGLIPDEAESVDMYIVCKVRSGVNESLVRPALPTTPGKGFVCASCAFCG